MCTSGRRALGPLASGTERRTHPVCGTLSWQLLEDKPPVRPLEGLKGSLGCRGWLGESDHSPATDTLGDPISNPRSGSQAHQ